MQLRKRKTADVDSPDPMKALRVGARLTDTFRVRTTVQVHVSSGKRAVSKAVSNETLSVAVAPAARRARQGQIVTAAAAAAPSAEAPAEQLSADAAVVPSMLPKRQKRASKKAVKGAAAEGVEEAARDALAAPLPPLNAERIAIGVAHLASVNTSEQHSSDSDTPARNLSVQNTRQHLLRCIDRRPCEALHTQLQCAMLVLTVLLPATELAQLIAENGQPEQLVPSNGSTFASLAHSIVSQQLATGAARTIHGRFLTACKVARTSAQSCWAACSYRIQRTSDMRATVRAIARHTGHGSSERHTPVAVRGGGVARGGAGGAAAGSAGGGAVRTEGGVHHGPGRALRGRPPELRRARRSAALVVPQKAGHLRI